jgi:ADP-heptose:LPS heptosyltransferase
MTQPEPRNILVMILGQLGDVVLALPALSAIKTKYPGAQISVLAAASTREMLEISQLADGVIPVDRKTLRKGPIPWAIWQLLRLVRDVRRRKFDLVIDLHSLYETNILGFLSGAPKRLFANRENRSIDLLSNVRPRPPIEDKTIHKSEYYMAALTPLDISRTQDFHLPVTEALRDDLAPIIENARTVSDRVVGLFVGAGHPGRQWGLEKFAALAAEFKKENAHIIVILGPEESALAEKIPSLFPQDTHIAAGLSLRQLVALISKLDLLVSHDTGPSHIAASLDVPMVVVMRDDFEYKFAPLGKYTEWVATAPMPDITVDDVLQGAKRALEKSSVSVARP